MNYIMKYINDEEKKVVDYFIEFGRCPKGKQNILENWMHRYIAQSNYVPKFIENYLVERGLSDRKNFYHSLASYEKRASLVAAENKPNITIGKL